MKVEEGKFYFIKQEFFEKVKDELLLKNKGDENKRLKPYKNVTLM